MSGKNAMVIQNFTNPNKALLRVNKKQGWAQRMLGALAGTVVSTVAYASPGLCADRIAFYYPPFGEFTLSADDLETFAQTGKITEGFAFYASRISKAQLAQFRELLRTSFPVNATLASQLTYSPLGESVVKRLAQLIQTDTKDSDSSFKALRASLILAAATPKGLYPKGLEPKGLYILNVIRRYPSNTIRLNLTEGQEIFADLSQLLRRRDAIVAFLKQFSDAEIANQPNIDFAQQPDLRLQGNFGWKVRNLPMNDISRQSRVFQINLYVPQTKSNNIPKSPFPVIVVSHGVAEDIETFAYVAQHLASYGFAVAVLEHPGSDAKKYQQFFAGLDTPPSADELINRPLDVKFVLDQLQQLNNSDSNTDINLTGKLNLQQVGAIGHSYGGYTALVLAGATIDFQQVRKLCDRNNSLNLSSFLQCRAQDLNQKQIPILQDSRIKAIMALNPLDSIVLGQSGLSKIQIPVMLVGGSQDIITPAVPEQVIPFTWLQTPVKYLALMENGTHFSTSEKLDNSPGVLPVPAALIGPDPALAQTYVKAFSVAFFKSHLLNQQQYRPFLTAGYSKYISKPPLNLNLIQSLTPKQLEPFLNQGVGSKE